MSYTLITINYNGFTNKLEQNIILEEKFFLQNEEDITYALEDNFWAYDLDGENNHVRGEYSFSKVHKRDILNTLSNTKKDDKELEQILKFEVEIGSNILENMGKVFKLLKGDV